MSSETQTIEVDPGTAESLRHLAKGRGVTVAKLVAELVPVAADSEAMLEFERRWTAVEGGAGAAAHQDVVRWLETWGTSSFRPWHDR